MWLVVCLESGIRFNASSFALCQSLLFASEHIFRAMVWRLASERVSERRQNVGGEKSKEKPHTLAMFGVKMNYNNKWVRARATPESVYCAWVHSTHYEIALSYEWYGKFSIWLRPIKQSVKCPPRHFFTFHNVRCGCARCQARIESRHL